MDPIIFLDFDGVLNSHQFLYRADRPKNMEFVGNEHLMFDPLAVARINQVIERSGAKVVVSSSWRHGHSRKRLQEILQAAGFTGKIIGTTPARAMLHGNVRGAQIQAWLDLHNPRVRFCIIDDDSDMAHLMHKLVKTAFLDGFQDRHIELALAHLQS